MMVQGHTIHAVLADDFRTGESIFFNIWHFMRGFTAPIFMFTAGTVFTFLLCKQGGRLIENPRVRIGLKRILSLFIIGYVLRYPSHRVFEIFHFTDEQWARFLAVDALHLIASGLFLIILLKFLSERFNISLSLLTIGVTVAVFFMNILIQNTQWNDFIPLFFSQYLSSADGSQFPLFPWIGFMTAGAYFGSMLAHNKIDYSNPNVIKTIFSFGILLLMSSYLFSSIESIFTPLNNSIALLTGLSFFRLGVVIIMLSIIMMLSRRIGSIPFIIRALGKHSLVIYVVHLILVYGSSWVPGLAKIFGKALNTYEALLAAALMVTAMSLLGYALERYKFQTKTYPDKIFGIIKRLRIQLQNK